MLGIELATGVSGVVEGWIILGKADRIDSYGWMLWVRDWNNKTKEGGRGRRSVKEGT